MKSLPEATPPVASVTFGFRDEGLEVRYHCERLRSWKPRIRYAGALGIRSRVIPGIWRLNRSGKRWTLYSEHPQIPLISVLVGEVRWALSGPPSADFETYGNGTARWRIVAKEQQCMRCEKLYNCDPRKRISLCPACSQRMRERRDELSPEEWENELDDWLYPSEAVSKRFQSDQAGNRRWLRELVAEGSHTPAEFRRLCARYGHICLSCRRKCPLEADHVIPLESGGSDRIENIQPLCKSCNSSKGAKATDYRRRYRTAKSG